MTGRHLDVGELAGRGREGDPFLRQFCRIERELHPLPYEINDPETAFQFVRGWLCAKGRDFGPESGGDGSDVKGYRVETTSDFYEVMTVTARYNYYSK